MGQKGEQLRSRIVAAADQLFYQQGYENTSFSDIAAAVDISRGNFYYHFKSKDEILDAVIEFRHADIEQMINSWNEKYQDPKKRVECYINILTDNSENIRRHGCPHGTLCSELAKLNHAMLNNANNMLTLFRTWLTNQFSLMGFKKNAQNYAMHLLARSQGIAMVANSFSDRSFLRSEAKLMKQWLNSLDGD